VTWKDCRRIFSTIQMMLGIQIHHLTHPSFQTLPLFSLHICKLCPVFQFCPRVGLGKLQIKAACHSVKNHNRSTARLLHAAIRILLWRHNPMELIQQSYFSSFSGLSLFFPIFSVFLHFIFASNIYTFLAPPLVSAPEAKHS
jgi:hypothetical protein